MAWNEIVCVGGFANLTWQLSGIHDTREAFVLLDSEKRGIFFLFVCFCFPVLSEMMEAFTE